MTNIVLFPGRESDAGSGPRLHTNIRGEDGELVVDLHVAADRATLTASEVRTAIMLLEHARDFESGEVLS